ncbi:MAG: TIGR04282 family arsenosugar biosynthesis glycosyltransferase [Burkholderiales bacterium]
MARIAHCVLQIFTKAPVAGEVKTRLCPPLTPNHAVELHRRLLWRALETASRADLGVIELWCTPDSEHDFFQQCMIHFDITLHVQSPGNLGDRMALALEDVLTRAGSALLMGSDCPGISASYLQQAAYSLAQRPNLVFGPAEDGGYGLIGVRESFPDVFSDIPWGTATVMPDTRARLKAMGVEFVELAPIWDVDRPADLVRLEQDRYLRYLLHELNA